MKNKVEVVGEVFAPLDSKDYSQYFGQIRSARPDTIYTSVAGNDTVRLLTQLDEFGILRNTSIVGSSGTITSQNLAAVGKASEGYITGTGYSPKLDTAENKKFVGAYRAMFKVDPDLFAADSYSLLYAYEAAVEKAGSTDTGKVRDALRGLSWQTPAGGKSIRAGDNQAMQPMYIVKISKGQFDVIGNVGAEDAIGPDQCTRF